MLHVKNDNPSVDAYSNITYTCKKVGIKIYYVYTYYLYSIMNIISANASRLRHVTRLLHLYHCPSLRYYRARRGVCIYKNTPLCKTVIRFWRILVFDCRVPTHSPYLRYFSGYNIPNIRNFFTQ